MDAWIDSLPVFSRNHELGEIDDLFEAAALGELEDTGDARTPIKPIRADPDVYELRRKALSKQLRFYHAEPAEMPEGLVALHKHIKDHGPQQDEIDFAVKRYSDGHLRGEGHNRTCTTSKLCAMIATCPPQSFQHL